MLKIRTSIHIFSLVNFLSGLFVFIAVVDPSDFLHLKIPCFAILFLSCLLTFQRIFSVAIVAIISIYSILIITSILGFAFNYKYDNIILLGTYKAFSMIFLLLWINKLEFLNKLILPSIIIAVATIIIFYIMLVNPGLEFLVYNFSAQNDTILIMSRREFLGITVVGVYFRSLPLLLITSSIFIYKLFNQKRSKFKTFVLALLFTVAILMGGTRASMLSVITAAFLIIFDKLRKTKYGRNISIFLFLGFVFIIATIFFLLVTEKGEASNEMKYGHFESYKVLVSENPQILFFGQGPGAIFYSQNFKKEIAETEWSYLELFRNFGVPLGLVIILIYTYPLYLLYKKRKVLEYSKPLFIGYFFYLLVAGTNPLLLGSNGLMALLVVYSYTKNPKYEINDKNITNNSNIQPTISG